MLGLSLGASAVYSIVSLAAQAHRGARPRRPDASRSTRRDRVASGSTSPTSSSTSSSGCSPSRSCSTCCGSRAAARSAASGSTSRGPAATRHPASLLVAVIGVPGPRALRDRPVARLHGRGADLTRRLVLVDGADPRASAPSRRRSPKRSSSSATSSRGSRELGVGPWATILSSAVLRGTYHLYQGFGPFVGNVAMGIVFGWCYAALGSHDAARHRALDHRHRVVRRLPARGRLVARALRRRRPEP